MMHKLTRRRGGYSPHVGRRSAAAIVPDTC